MSTNVAARLEELERRDAEATAALTALAQLVARVPVSATSAGVVGAWRPSQGPILPDDAHEQLLERLARCSGPGPRLEVVRTVLAGPIVSCAQLGRILDQLPYLAEKETAVTLLARHVADPPNVHVLRPHVVVHLSEGWQHILNILLTQWGVRA